MEKLPNFDLNALDDEALIECVRCGDPNAFAVLMERYNKKRKGKLDMIFIWIHPSDLHFQAVDEYDSNIILKALLKDIEEEIRTEGWQPNFIIITGDVASASHSDEYAMAQQFLDDLIQTTGIGQDRLLIIPGNHFDIDGPTLYKFVRLDFEKLTGKIYLRRVWNKDSSTYQKAQPSKKDSKVILFCLTEMLVELYRNGDNSALDKLMKLCIRLLFSYFDASTNNPEDAEDYTQEVLIRVLKHLDDTTPKKGKFIPWLYTIAKRFLIDQFRRAVRRVKTIPILEEGEEEKGLRSYEIADRVLLPEEIAMIKEIVEKIGKAIDEVPPTQRKDVYAHYRDGKSCKEIAEERGVSEQAIKQSLQHARENLKKSLGCIYPDIRIAAVLKVYFCVLDLIKEVSENER